MPTSTSLIRFLLVSSLLVPGLAAAEDDRPTLETKKRPISYIYTPGAAAPPGQQNVTSRIVYLHRCPEISGCSVRGGGTNDSRMDISTIAEGIRQLGEFSAGSESWSGIVDCVKTTFAPFNITITDVDPGTTTPHFEAMFGGKPSDIFDDPNGDYDNTIGLAPFDCGEIPNAIVYVFNQGADVNKNCWTAAQEIAHAFGLEHEFLQKDPLTYLDGDLPKRFRDVSAPCGEYASGTPACRCGSQMQNSYRDILALFGPGAPTPPDVLFKQLTDGKQVQPGFEVVIEALDDVRVEKVDLLIDGVMVGTSTMDIGDDFIIETPTLDLGAHTLEARATDVQGVVGTTTLNVTMGPPCTQAKGCTGDDVCVAGICVPGPDAAGGLGSICQKDTECLSHTCTDANEAHNYCTETCSQSMSGSCPSGFDCIEGGVCWPADDSGCCDSGRGAPHGPMLLGLGVALVLVRRRRKR